MMARSAGLCVLLAVGLVSGGSVQAPIEVPGGAQVTVDGIMNDTEWAGAAVVAQGPVQIAMQISDGFLEVGLRTPPLYVASLCVARGDEVYILHASSAVGRGVYRRAGDAWALAEQFEWRLRGGDDAPATAAEQAEHLEEHGWLANTTAAGRPGETEFRIGSRYLSGPVTRIALGLMFAGDPAELGGWPMQAGRDGCTIRPTIAGPLPETSDFDLTTWTQLDLPGS